MMFLHLFNPPYPAVMSIKHRISLFRPQRTIQEPLRKCDACLVCVWQHFYRSRQRTPERTLCILSLPKIPCWHGDLFRVTFAITYQKNDFFFVLTLPSLHIQNYRSFLSFPPAGLTQFFRM